MPALLVLGLLSACMAYLVQKWFTLGRREVGLPPGPPTLPALGNVHQMPLSNAHLRYVELWA
jgi:cytochrome P450 family 619